MNNPVVILGAGLTGLGAAKHLPGSVVYEAKDHSGGHVFSHEQGGIYFDEGAHICHAKDKAWVKSLYENAGQVVRIDQSLVSNYWHGRWVTYPVQNHLRDLPADLRIKALTEIVEAQMSSASQSASNYDTWCRNQYGNFLADHFYKEYTEKYWRVSMTEMDTDWLAGRLLPSQLQRIIHGAIAPQDEKQSVFSSFHYPAKGGFFSFFENFYRGVEVKRRFQVSGFSVREKTITFANGERVKYYRCINTIPLPVLIRVMDEVPDSIRADAATLRHTKLIGVNIVVNKPALVPHHWFYIYDPDIEVSRVKVMSNIIPDSLPKGKTVLQTEIFRRDDETYDLESLKAKAVEEMGRILGFDPVKDVESIHHVEVSHAYTIPTLGRQAAVDRISEWLESKNIITAGLYGKWKYAWSDQAFQAGKQAAEKVTRLVCG